MESNLFLGEGKNAFMHTIDFGWLFYGGLPVFLSLLKKDYRLKNPVHIRLAPYTGIRSRITSVVSADYFN